MFRKTEQLPILIDFGIVRDLSESSLTLTWLPQGPGTPYYSAPEQLNNEKQLIGWRTDQFGLGVVLGICLTGRHPFEEDGMTPAEVVNAVAQRKTISKKFCQTITEQGFRWMLRMLEPWPVRRYPSPLLLLQNIQKG
jgi:serine/threonine protein kinase